MKKNDIIIIKENVQDKNFLTEMCAFCNKQAKIVHVYKDGCFLIDLDDGFFIWESKFVKKVKKKRKIKKVNFI